MNIDLYILFQYQAYYFRIPGSSLLPEAAFQSREINYPYRIKTKEELIGDIIFILKSPATNVIGALKSGGQKIAGIVKALEERASA